MKRQAALLILILLLFSGCASLSVREFSMISPHFKQNREWQNVGDYTADSFTEVQSILNSLIASGKTEGVVWVGFSESDMYSALDYICEDTGKNDPIAAFAVEKIEYELTPLVAENKLVFSISYSRSQKDIYDIKHVFTKQELSNEISECLSMYQDNLLLMVSSFDEISQDIERIFNYIYHNEPDYAYGIAGMEYEAYPDEGDTRVVEIRIRRGATADVSKNLAKMVNTMARGVVNDLAEGLEKSEKASLLCKYLHDNVNLDAEEPDAADTVWNGYTSTAFGAIIEKESDSDGLAMAYKKLCSFAGIDCVVVTGELNGAGHSWNIVLLEDGGWYHVDCSSKSGATVFLSDDMIESQKYFWERESYPECGSEGFSEAFSVRETELFQEQDFDLGEEYNVEDN